MCPENISPELNPNPETNPIMKEEEEEEGPVFIDDSPDEVILDMKVVNEN